MAHWFDKQIIDECTRWVETALLKTVDIDSTAPFHICTASLAVFCFTITFHSTWE